MLLVSVFFLLQIYSKSISEKTYNSGSSVNIPYKKYFLTFRNKSKDTRRQIISFIFWTVSENGCKMAYTINNLVSTLVQTGRCYMICLFIFSFGRNSFIDDRKYSVSDLRSLVNKQNETTKLIEPFWNSAKTLPILL